MQTGRLLQAVILMLILAMAASCATSNEYISRIFKPRSDAGQALTKKEPKPVRFLDFDSTMEETEEWVKADNKTDPAGLIKPELKNDSIPVVIAEVKKDTAVLAKAAPIVSESVARNIIPDARLLSGQGTRTKRTRDQ